jgi:hypothetical protein
MNLGLLLSQLPHVQESRAHYDAMLAMHAREPHKLAAFWQRLKALFSQFSALFRHAANIEHGSRMEHQVPIVSDCEKISD